MVAEGHAVSFATDGGAALAAVERAAPDVLVLDVAMPGLDGLAVCRRLRAKGLLFPILLLTARDGLSDRVAGLDAGADDYLVKPFEAEELSARIRALLRRGQKPAETLAYADLVLDVGSRTASRDRPPACEAADIRWIAPSPVGRRPERAPALDHRVGLWPTI